MKGESHPKKLYFVSYRAYIYRIAGVMAASPSDAERIADNACESEFHEIESKPEWTIEYVRESEFGPEHGLPIIQE